MPSDEVIHIPTENTGTLIGTVELDQTLMYEAVPVETVPVKAIILEAIPVEAVPVEAVSVEAIQFPYFLKYLNVCFVHKMNSFPKSSIIKRFTPATTLVV